MPPLLRTAVVVALGSAACGGQTAHDVPDAASLDAKAVAPDVPDAAVYCNLYSGPVTAADAAYDCGVYQCVVPHLWCEGPFEGEGWGCCTRPPLPDGALSWGTPSTPNECTFSCQ